MRTLVVVVERDGERTPLRNRMKIPRGRLYRLVTDEVCSSREVLHVAHMRECLIIQLRKDLGKYAFQVFLGNSSSK